MLPSQSILKRQIRLAKRLRKAPSPLRVPCCCSSHYQSISRNKSFAHSSRSYFSTRVPYSTTAITEQSAAVLASAYDDDDDDDDAEDAVAYAEEDEDIERFLRDSMNHFLPNAAPRYASRLELELGELNTRTSNGSLWSEGTDDIDDDDDDAILEEDATESLISSEMELIPDETPPAAPQTPTSSSSFTSRREETRQKSVRELLADFDPANEPQISDGGDRDRQLEELQLWLECSAQHEALAKHQKVLDAARERRDYTSLSTVQKNMMRWFHKLQDAIERHQHHYLSGQSGRGESYVSEKKFGPYICTLPAPKLALITSNVAILQAILVPGKLDHAYGCPLLKMADSIGKSVEEEVVIHRMLHKRFEEARKERKRLKQMECGNDSEEEHDLLEALLSPPDDIEKPEKETGAKKDKLKVNITHTWSYAASHLNSYLEELSQNRAVRNKTLYAIRKARAALESEEEWSKTQRIQLGAVLFKCLLETATVTGEKGQEEPAFSFEKKWLAKNRIQGFVKINDRLYQLITTDRMESLAATSTRHKPMIVPPKPWTGSRGGGYRMLKVDLMRYHGCETQRDALQMADCSTVHDGLNALGRVAWQINQPILDVAWKCWHDNIPLGDIPSRVDLLVPEEPIQPEWPEGVEKGTTAYDDHVNDFRMYVEKRAKYLRVLQKNMDLRSLRCSAELKLDQAEKFQHFEKLYFPYNLDFRGRAYPVPPHLSNVGSDLCRGMLRFSESKPLGERGLFWLKVHLANFAGADKMTFEERANFVDEHMEQVRESVRDPFAGERWWMSLEDPFQGLATAREIIQALDSGDPASYECSLPVHMDGSCNGLQHYAALGRDYVGGKAVNLCAFDEPQDVYIGVMHEVVRRVAEEAEREVDFDTSDISSLSTKQRTELKNNRSAKLVNGLIDRGVVKRTVMTSVYGVTYVGAREQIREKIESKLVGQGYDLDEINREVFNACGYLATVTMDVIGELFTGAKQTMNWLASCARMITQHGYPVAWVSPIGLPAIQPYRQKKVATLVTLIQTLTLMKDGDDLPIHRARQATAFPPNYIHSLDSSHMLLTALEMDRRGLTFSAVHDSFWTHACDVDEMNTTLREVFVDLYSQPLLERLKESWEKRYPDLDLPDLPERGTLDLDEVKRAKYFFQ